MQILIEKDSATLIPREIADEAEAQALVDQGFTVYVQNEDGSKTPFAATAPDGDDGGAAEAQAEEAPAEAPKPAAKASRSKKA